jgi:hypothetical protein
LEATWTFQVARQLAEPVQSSPDPTLGDRDGCDLGMSNRRSRDLVKKILALFSGLKRQTDAQERPFGQLNF